MAAHRGLWKMQSFSSGHKRFFDHLTPFELIPTHLFSIPDINADSFKTGHRQLSLKTVRNVGINTLSPGIYSKDIRIFAEYLVLVFARI